MDQGDKVHQQKNPRETANWVSVALFWWLNPLLALGFRKDLELEDLYKAKHEDESEVGPN